MKQPARHEKPRAGAARMPPSPGSTFARTTSAPFRQPTEVPVGRAPRLAWRPIECAHVVLEHEQGVDNQPAPPHVSRPRDAAVQGALDLFGRQGTDLDRDQAVAQVAVGRERRRRLAPDGGVVDVDRVGDQGRRRIGNGPRPRQDRHGIRDPHREASAAPPAGGDPANRGRASIRENPSSDGRSPSVTRPVVKVCPGARKSAMSPPLLT